MGQATDQVARNELLMKAGWAVQEKKFDAAFKLFGQAREVDPGSQEAKNGMDLVQKMREGKLTPEQLQEQVVPKAGDAVVRLAAGAKPHTRSKNGTTTVILAATFGREETLLLLLDGDKHQLVKQEANDGLTPLMAAALGGHVSTARLLLSRGADPKAVANSDGWTALMCAAQSDNVELINCAVSDRTGTAVMEVPHYQSGGENFYQAHLVSPEEERAVGLPLRTLTVRLRSVDSLFLELPGRLTFVKIDVEGHEWAAVAGGRRTLERHHPALFLEVTTDPDRPETEAHRLFAYLRSAVPAVRRAGGSGILIV